MGENGSASPRGAVKGAALWLLALITFSGTVGMYIFVPALPEARESLHASAGAMQLTISLYVLGLALGQPVYGPLSDRFGRRPVLMGGLALYTVAGVAAWLAPNAETLILARLFQALGGGAGVVLGRAIVRDTAPAKEAAQRLALLNLLVTAGPGLAPLAGGLLLAVTEWRMVLLALCGLGAVNLLLTWRMLPETGRAAAPPSAATVLRDYGRLAGSPVFIGYAVTGGCLTTAAYAFFSAAPFIFQELGRPPHEVGIYLTLLVIGISIGNFMASRVLGRVVLDRVIARCSLIGMAAMLAMLGAVLAGWFSVPVAMGAMFVFTLCVGLGGPAALAQGISLNPRVIGSASGLYGFVQMAVGSLCSALAGLGPDPALSAAVVLAGATVVGQVCFRMAVAGKRRLPPPAAE